MINFSVPDYVWHQPVYMFFMNLRKDCPEVFIEDRQIESVYGLPGDLIWQGGRIVPAMNKDETQRRVDELRDMGLHIKHVCTNCLLEPRHVYDDACNYWLAKNEHAGDSVVVNSDFLAEHIAKNYPKYNIILSITRGPLTPEQHNQQNEAGKGTVLYYSHNRNEDILKQIKHPEMVEILAAEECEVNCPARQEHYRVVSRTSLGIDTPADRVWSCPRERVPNFYIDNDLKRPSSINNDWINYINKTYGFNTIKVAGRDQPSWVIAEYMCYYLIKPEYRDIVRMECWWKTEYRQDTHYKV